MSANGQKPTSHTLGAIGSIWVFSGLASMMKESGWRAGREIVSRLSLAVEPASPGDDNIVRTVHLNAGECRHLDYRIQRPTQTKQKGA